MNIRFNELCKIALMDIINKSSNDYIRIKVAYGCGKPYYEIFADFKKSDDVEVEIDGINFVVNEKDERACSEIEILYNPEVYNNGFYIK